MVWPLENGLELKMESDGDKLTLRFSDGEVYVRELVLDEPFAAFSDQVTDRGARIELEVTREKT